MSYKHHLPVVKFKEDDITEVWGEFVAYNAAGDVNIKRQTKSGEWVNEWVVLCPARQRKVEEVGEMRLSRSITKHSLAIRQTSKPAQSRTKLCPPSSHIQQQPPPDCLTGVLAFILTFGLSLAAVVGPIRFFISAAIVTNACSTLVALFALVSRNGMRSWSAYSYNTTKRSVTHTCVH